MKVTVSQEECIGCGMCIDICPKVFKYNDDFKSEVIESSAEETNETENKEEIKEKVEEAKNACPVDAIIVE